MTASSATPPSARADGNHNRIRLGEQVVSTADHKTSRPSRTLCQDGTQAVRARQPHSPWDCTDAARSDRVAGRAGGDMADLTPDDEQDLVERIEPGDEDPDGWEESAAG